MIQSRVFVVVCCLLLFTSGPAYSQAPTATISGIVRDQTGAVLPGVSIQVINRETGGVRTAITDEAGRYRVPALEAGTYAIEGTLPGVRKVVEEGVALTVGRQAGVGLTTEVGQLSGNLSAT